LDEVPTDRFTLAVLIRRDVELVGVLQGRLELLDDVLLAGRDDVYGLEAFVDVDTQASPALALDLTGDLGSRGRQVADVTHAGLDLIIGRKEAADGASLGGGLHDDETVLGFVQRQLLWPPLGKRGHYTCGLSAVKWRSWRCDRARSRGLGASFQRARRLLIARPRVTSSAYSRSPPTGNP